MWPVSEGTFRVVNPGWSYRMSYLFECLLGCRGLFSYQAVSSFPRCRGRISCGGEGGFRTWTRCFWSRRRPVIALLPLFYRRIRRLGVWIPLSYAGDSDPVAHRRALAAGSAVPTSEVCDCRAAGRRGDRGGAGGSLLPLLRRLRGGQFAAGTLHPQRPQHLPGERVRVEFRPPTRIRR